MCIETAIAQRAWPWRLQLDELEDAGRLIRQHHRAIGQLQRLVDVVRDEHHSLAGLEPDPLHFDPHARAHVRVERRKWLVHQHDLGIDRERTRDRDPLALATREHRRVFARVSGEAHEG